MTKELPLIYIDNDIILKLCACDLFWKAIETLEFAKDNLRVLNRAKFVFGGRGRVAKKYDSIDPTIKKKAISVVMSIETVMASASNPLINLKDCPGLDLGEAILIGEAITQTSFYFISGDKKCFRALGRQTELAVARERLSGRVVCLEQVIRLLIETEGFERVRDKVVPVRECDQALKVIFGSGMLAERENSLAALSHYLNQI